VLWLGMPPSIVKNSPTSAMPTVQGARRTFIAVQFPFDVECCHGIDLEATWKF
jgi:hypothetical protein